MQNKIKNKPLLKYNGLFFVFNSYILIDAKHDVYINKNIRQHMAFFLTSNIFGCSYFPTSTVKVRCVIVLYKGGILFEE